MFRFRLTLSAVAAAAAAVSLLAACGGGSADAAPAGALDNDDDNPDAATLAQVAALKGSALRAARARSLGSTESAVDDALAGAGYGWYPGVTQTNLVANKPEFGAQIVEPELRNAWGIAIRPTGLGGHFWIGAAETAKSIEYVGDVAGTPLFQDELKIVQTGGPTTGVAFNPGAQFVITQPHANGAITNGAKFLFANLSGTISAWTERKRPDGGFDHPLDSLTVVDGTARHSAFAGVTLLPGADRMVAADFGAEAALRVYDGTFAEQAPLRNPFEPEVRTRPDGFEAFNVQTIGDSMFAMYGRHVPPPEPGTVPPKEGRLAEFDADGKFVARWYGRGHLNYPWGVQMAPQDFGIYSGCLLVGNFGDGTVVAFHPRLKVALDYVRDDRGNRVVIDGLWGLQFGNGASLGEANHLYFAAGPNHEEDGLFGKLQANPRTLPYIGGVSLCQ